MRTRSTRRRTPTSMFADAARNAAAGVRTGGGARAPPTDAGADDLGGPTASAGPAHTAGVYPAGKLMTFFSRKSSRPSSPNSRPMPDDLKPPNGDEKSIGTLELTM
jgi:hypothetical protein